MLILWYDMVWMSIAKWLQTPDGNGESPMQFFWLPPRFHNGITMYGNGKTKWLIILIWCFFLNSQMVTDTLWKWFRDWIVPIWKWGAIIPVSIWGFPYGNGEPELFNPHMETVIIHYHIGMCQSPFPYGNTHMVTGIH